MDGYGPLMTQPGSDDRLAGVAIGIVTNNKDPQGLGRVKASLPWMADQVESDWARVAAPMAGQNRGVYFLPEVGDEVLVAFEHGNPASPYVLGGLWNGQDLPPESNQDGRNDVRAIRSRSGSMIRFSDAQDDQQIEITDSSGLNSIVISVRDDSITIAAGGSVTIQVGAAQVTLSGDGSEISISAATISIEADDSLELSAGGSLTIQGATVNIN